jgi:NAD(P)-dependent dehydrogenase (short-subunit alcohol dehydrogenase family)
MKRIHPWLLFHSLAAPHRTAFEAAQLHADNIEGKLFIITGAYGGIGSETARAILAMRGKVVIGGRSSDKVAAFVNQLSMDFKGEKIDGYALDLADLESVRSFATYVLDTYQDQEIDCLINNAGIIAPVAETIQGLELQMGTNVVGHFLLSKLLISKTRRQVWLTSTSHMAVSFWITAVGTCMRCTTPISNLSACRRALLALTLHTTGIGHWRKMR